jgi:hypothetical protein
MGTCSDDLGLGSQNVLCFNSGTDLQQDMDSAAGRAYTYRLNQMCKDESDVADCDNPRACTNAAGVPGTLYSVLRRPIDTPGAAFQAYAVVCLTADEEPRFQVITWQAVWRVMRTLDWPAADLVVQPVGGRTLINFETNFLTTTTEPALQQVRLLGRDVEIEATPVTYTWHWAGPGETTAREDVEPLTTEEPGEPHVHGKAHEVFHVYTDAGVRVHPSVDVTYRGRYRVEGGRWIAIPERLTIPGAGVPLEVVSARVHLVG